MKVKGMALVAVALVLAPFTPVEAQQAPKTAYIDLAEVFQGYYKTTRRQAALKKQENLYQERADELRNELKQLQEEQQKLDEESLNVALSDETRTEKRLQAQRAAEELRAKQQKLRQFYGEKKQALQKDYLKVREELIDEIMEFLDGYADKKKIELIFDVSGLTNNFLPVVVRYPEEKEITEDVLAALNKGHEEEIVEQGETGGGLQPPK